jgi:hypothetical protein
MSWVRGNVIAGRSTLGIVTYCTLNALIIAAEARWHLLYRLTLWDLSQIRTLIILIARLIHTAL